MSKHNFEWSRFITVALAFAIGSYTGCKRTSTVVLPDVLRMEVTGENFEWHIRYAGVDEILHTDDDYFTKRNIVLAAGTHTQIHLVSHDYVYNFAIPHLNLKEIAVPSLDFGLDFRPLETGDFVLQGDQLCGYQHPNLIGQIRILEPRHFAQWQTETARTLGVKRD